ncbi:MAG: hypothetical protein KC609_06195, partial [Myxococcales bacterium]|nr:hypothetical protein [Myxococcales bacterium]
ISTCLAQHGDPFDSDGLTCCLAAALKVSPNCSTCFRELAICTRDNCQNECELGSDETCRNCADEKGCTATFELCAGTTSGGEDTLTPDATSDLVTGDALDDALTDAPTADLEDDSAADDLSTSDTATLDSEPGDGLQADVLADLAADLEDDGALGQDADGGDDADL